MGCVDCRQEFGEGVGEDSPTCEFSSPTLTSHLCLLSAKPNKKPREREPQDGVGWRVDLEGKVKTSCCHRPLFWAA